MGGNGFRIGRLAPALLLAASAAASAQPFPPAPPDRRETVKGWRVQHVGDEEMGRDVRMALDRTGFSIVYYANYWHGNGGTYYGLRIDRRGRGCAGDEWSVPEPAPPAAREAAAAGRRLRARLAGHLAECGLDARRADALLQGFTPAYARFAVLAGQAHRHVSAVGCSIEHYPEGPAVVRRLCHRR